jgi:hypothetical protein
MTKMVNVILAVLVVAPVPLVTTIEDWLAEFVTLSMHKAAPAVAPTMLTMSSVEDPVIEVLLITKVCEAPPAMLTPEKATDNTLPFAVWGEVAAATVVGVSKSPDPVPAAFRFPLVAVTPVAPVTVVVEAMEPGAMKVEGILRVNDDPDLDSEIWLVVPEMVTLPGAAHKPAPVVW